MLINLVGMWFSKVKKSQPPKITKSPFHSFGKGVYTKPDEHSPASSIGGEVRVYFSDEFKKEPGSYLLTKGGRRFKDFGFFESDDLDPFDL
jgi:hypothetical protein